jgi:signal transduction histidine kinase
MTALTNLDLLTVGVSIAGSVILGVAVFFTNTKAPSNRWFFAFTVVTAIWGVLNFLNYQTRDVELALWLIRGVIFFAVWQTLSFYLFLLYFSNSDKPARRLSLWFFLVLAGTTAILTLTPYVFSSVTFEASSQVAQPTPGPAVAIFALTALLLVCMGLLSLLKEIPKATKEFALQLKTLAWSAGIMFALIAIFDLVFPVALENTKWIPLSSIFIMPFIIGTSYAILRQHLFNIKVIATSALVFILSIVSFGEIIFSNTLPLILFRTSVFILVLVFGVNLIRGVIREVEQREKIQKLAEELADTNERQKGLIRFISHEVKGFLTKNINVFAALVEGDFGTLPETMQPIVGQALAQSRDGVRSTEDILKASNQKNGMTTYKKEPFDLKALAEQNVEKSRLVAEGKGLTLSFTADAAGAPYTFVGDQGEIGDHVLRNLIDNSINYTPSGSITISLKKENDRLVFSVRDTGIGITEEDKKRLFTEGGHGKDSQKVNVHSTGYGLFIAKQIVEAHRGTIRAESQGQGKGSTFIVELPLT